MKSLVMFVTAVTAVSAWAAVSSKVGVTGYVLAFDAKTVTIESGTEKIEIPKEYVPQAVKAGEMLTVSMTEQQARDLKHKPLKK